MQASIMQASTTLPPTSERPAALVRSIGGTDAPAAGPWHFGSGQSLGLVARGLRPRPLAARVQRGTLFVTDDLLGSSLEFVMLIPELACVGFTTWLTRLLSIDSWQADGTTTTASGSRPVSLRLRDNGVFQQRGRQPCLWLTVHATVYVPEVAAAVGRRRARRLELEAELNLHPGEQASRAATST